MEEDLGVAGAGGVDLKGRGWAVPRQGIWTLVK